MNQKQESALQIARMAVQDWRAEEAMSATGIAITKHNAVTSIQRAVKAGVSQAAIAKECGWTRQRVHQLVTTGR